MTPIKNDKLHTHYKGLATLIAFYAREIIFLVSFVQHIRSFYMDINISRISLLTNKSAGTAQNNAVAFFKKKKGKTIFTNRMRHLFFINGRTQFKAENESSVAKESALAFYGLWEIFSQAFATLKKATVDVYIINNIIIYVRLLLFCTYKCTLGICICVHLYAYVHHRTDVRYVPSSFIRKNRGGYRGGGRSDLTPPHPKPSAS